MLYEHLETGLRITIKIQRDTALVRTRDGGQFEVYTKARYVTEAGQDVLSEENSDTILVKTTVGVIQLVKVQ